MSDEDQCKTYIKNKGMVNYYASKLCKNMNQKPFDACADIGACSFLGEMMHTNVSIVTSATTGHP